MGTIFVDNLEPQSGTSLTLGASGDTVSLTSGAKTSGFGKIGQVLQTTVTAASFSMNSSTFAEITGLTVTITPTTTTSKVLVDFDICGGVDAYNGICFFRLMRDTTAIYVSDTTSGYTQTTHGGLRGSLDDNSSFLTNMKFLDSPTTSAAVKYSVQVATESSSYTYKLNKNGDDTASQGYSQRSASNVIAMEVLD
jgi:hypothetical protein